MSYYAIARGIQTGIFATSEEYDKYKVGKNSCGKKCKTEQEAKKYIASINKALQYDYYAFVDFEFTCSDKIKEFQNKNHIGEVLSIGLVICNKDGEIVDKFYETIRPKYNYKLTPFCKELTKLTQKEIDNSRNLPNVLSSAMKLISKYDIKFVYSFGTSDYLQTKRDVENYTGHALYKRSLKFVNMIRNCQKTTVNRLIEQMTEISLNDCKALLNIEGEVEHNALSDAIDLSAIYFKSIFNPPSAKKIAKYKEKREIVYKYKQFRNFKNNKLSITNEQQELLKNACEVITNNAKEIDDIKIKAIVDDILTLAGLEVNNINDYVDKYI